jgi:hypothetical protein
MAKITLDNSATGFNSVGKINANNDLVEDHLNNKVLYRDNPTGEPNQMLNSLDMNSQQILNLPDAVSNQEPATYKQVADLITGAEFFYNGTVVEEQTATSDGQSVFTLTNSYVPGIANTLTVFRNGVRIPPSAYTQTSSTSVTFDAAYAALIVTEDEFQFIINEVTSQSFSVAASTEKIFSSVDALRTSTGNDDYNEIAVTSYYEYTAVNGPNGGHRRHRTGGTNTSPTVGSPVAVSTIGTGTQVGYVWDGDGVEWFIDIEGVHKKYTSVASLRDSTGNDAFNIIEIESYYEIPYESQAGPKDGHKQYRTGGTNTNPTVGSPVAVSTIGTGTQAGYVWDADGIEWRRDTITDHLQGVGDMSAIPEHRNINPALMEFTRTAQSGAPTVAPLNIGQTYIDIATGTVYVATGTVDATSWKVV